MRHSEPWCIRGVNGSRATFGKLLHRTVPCVRTVANQIAMAKIDPVALFEKDLKAKWKA